MMFVCVRTARYADLSLQFTLERRNDNCKLLTINNENRYY